MKDCWPELQANVRDCARCRTDLRNIPVECPPGLLYPTGMEPSEAVRVLFIGVAPPETGCHFYTDPGDNLRRGLFDILRQLGRPCRDLADFIGRGFFLVHTAKCAIRGTTKPNLLVSRLCASTHLWREIECLNPDGLCVLSKNIGFPVAAHLSSRWGWTDRLPFGEITRIIIGGKSVPTIATTWPGREVHKPVAKVHAALLFSELGLPTWH